MKRGFLYIKRATLLTVRTNRNYLYLAIIVSTKANENPQPSLTASDV